MTPADYEYISNFLLGTSGLALGSGKEYLVEARLIPLAQSLGLEGISELVLELKKGAELKVTSGVTEAMTTNETSFFRDKTPFEELKNQIIPNLMEARKTSKRLKIWCAAAATGQEPYTISMILDDEFPQLRDWTVEILATDIDQQALERSRSGIYTQFEMQRGLPIQMLMKYFEQIETGWQIKENMRNTIQWKQLNLLDNFNHLGKFDIIFCRNVLIYFQQETKKDILDRFRTMIQDDGYLYLGAAETVLGITEAFDRIREYKSAVYVPAVGVRV
ncbi:MAG: protein-glutamate O-methyltransferase CheR [Planctomycetes bacterium]|nr:protein-glutamate O-methyltransferase CheR [Planctomycetota bacterium]